ncbi:MAG: shikimate kinase [Phycisphaerales bacterium]|nr:shikimate kinase [Phycisphaerales bacterium]
MKVALVGPRAVGKSTLGAAVADRLGWPFLDTDHELARQVGQPAGEFLASRGEAEFRRVEARVVLAALATPGPAVVALGGGAVLSPDIRVALAVEGTFTVRLEAAPAVLVRRIEQAPGTRPALTDLPLAQEVEALCARRAAQYREVSQDSLETFPANVDACVVALLAKIDAASRAS